MFKRLLLPLISLLLISGVLISSVTTAEDRGLGGTGISPEIDLNNDRGFGGTGLTPTELTAIFGEDRGLGGTGVIGTITAFGSIWVNGIEVEYDTNTQLTVDGVPAKTNALKIGQQVEMIAHLDSGEITASEIAIHHQVVAPVESIDHQKQVMSVLGQTVRLDQSVTDYIDIQPGNTIMVSGYRERNATIIATAVHKTDTTNLWTLNGTVSLHNGNLMIGDFKLPEESGLSIGDDVSVNGRIRNNEVIVENIIKRERILDGKVSNFFIETHQSDSGNHIRYSGGKINLDADRATGSGFAHVTFEKDKASIKRWFNKPAQKEVVPIRRAEENLKSQKPESRNLNKERPEIPTTRPHFQRGLTPGPGNGVRAQQR